jgi:CRP-like cAMP-binding protein
MANALRRVKVFKDLLPKERLELTKVLTFHKFTAGHHLIRDRQRMNTFHLVLAGKVRIDTHRSHRQSMKGELGATSGIEEKEVGPGFVIGEETKRALKESGCSEENRQHADFCAECLAETECLSFEWDDFKDLFYGAENVSQERKTSTLKVMGAFAVMSPTHLQALAEKFHVVSHVRNHVLATANEESHKIFIIMSGECKALLREGNHFMEIAVLGKGEVFGEVTACHSFLDVTIMSASNVDIMWIPQEVFRDPKEIPTSVVRSLESSYRNKMSFFRKRYLNLKAQMNEPEDIREAKNEARFFMASHLLKNADPADREKNRSAQRMVLDCHPYFYKAHPSGQLSRPESPVPTVAPVSYQDVFGQKNKGGSVFFNSDANTNYSQTAKSHALDGVRAEGRRPRSAPMRRRSQTEESIPTSATEPTGDWAQSTAANTLDSRSRSGTAGNMDWANATAPANSLHMRVSSPSNTFGQQRPATSDPKWGSSTTPIKRPATSDPNWSTTSATPIKFFNDGKASLTPLIHTMSSPALIPLLGSRSPVNKDSKQSGNTLPSHSRNLGQMYAKPPQAVSGDTYNPNRASVEFISKNLDLVFEDAGDPSHGGIVVV